MPNSRTQVRPVGSHPHVLQPWEYYKAPNGNTGFIHYSLGNFVSGQGSVAKKTSLILLVGFQKNKKNRLVIDGVRYVPAYMKRISKWSRTFTPLNKASKPSPEIKTYLNKIFSIYPEELRLNTNAPLTTCSE